MNVAVVDYNAGNTRSIYHALQRLGVDAEFTRDHAKIRSADKVIFPGVGEASTTMKFIRQFGLDDVIPNLTQPFFGICLGMQLMCRWSEENDTKCLGIFEADVKKFIPSQKEKVPHMGWNKIRNLSPPLFDADMEEQYVYFVHSYFVEITDHTASVAQHGQAFSAGIQKDNFYATQFHPEKSGDIGTRILRNFLELK